MENSIELFNCPLCPFCETGLDRLVKHIRHHIKPEPKSITSANASDDLEAGTKSATLQSVEHKELHLDDYINNLSSSKETPTTINLFTSAAINDSSSPPSSTHSSPQQSPSISNIKVSNPQSVAINDVNQRSAVKSHHQQHHQQPVRELVPQHHSNVEAQAPLQQQIQISPPHLKAPPPPHSMMYIRKDAPKYVQIHPRDHFGGNSPYVHPQQYINKGYVHEQYVPIAPAKVANFQEGKTMQQMEIHEAYHRTGHQHQQNAYVPQSQHRNIVSIKGHPNHPEMHANYAVRPNIHSPQQQQFDVHSPYQQQQRGAMTEHHLQSRIQSRINGMQHVELPNIGFPNNGTILLNPEQLLKMSGNTTSMDQLAGLLVVPLKRTADVAIQTEPVEVEAFIKSSDKSISSGVQTDLRMQYITEEIRHAPAPVFGQIRSTDALFECLICGEEFVNDQHLQNHVSTMHKHVCENCFHASTSLPEHVAHVTECGKCDAELLCMDCNSLFPSIKKLNQHRIKVHAIRMPFRCGICNQPFETHDAVMYHMNTHDNDMPEFKCRYCTKVFQSADALGKHFQRHKLVDVEHQCKFCRKTFNTDKLLRDHIGVAHVIRDNDYENAGSDEQPCHSSGQANYAPSGTNTTHSHPNTNKKYFLCKYCDLAFKNKELLSRHIKICSKNSSPDVTCFVCDVCKEFFESDNLRKVHLKHDHRRQNGYRCPKCSKVYRTWTRLKFHTKQQHLKKSCPDCNIIFTKEHILRKHQEDIHGKTSTQNGDRIYRCSDCNLSLYTLTDLTMHRRTMHPNSTKSIKTADQSSDATMLSFLDNQTTNDDHAFNTKDEEKYSSMDGEKKAISAQYTCERCNSTFEDEKRLKNHLGLTHGERPFVCEICNKRFQYSSQIVWHMKNHSNRPTNTQSKTCNSLWKAKTTLVSKLKPKTSTLGLMNYVCQFCGARFKQEKLLKNHKGSVHKIKLFSCYICGLKYGHSTELIWHVRTCKSKFIRENPGSSLPSEEALQPAAEEPTNLDGNEGNNQEPPELKAKSDLMFNNETDDVEMPGTNIQLSKEEAEELLQNDPEYDHARGEYTCPLCKKTTKSITGMKTHYGRVHGIWSKESSHKFANGQKITIWPCRNCDLEFHCFEEIKTHCFELHGLTVTKEDLDFETRQEFVANTPEPSLYTCQTCGMSFDNSKSIRVHTFKKHGILLNDVSLNESRNNDPATMSTSQTTTKPKSESFQNADDITEDELRFKCPRCKSQFRTTKALRVHSFKRHGVILSKQEMNKSKKWVATNATTPDYSSSHNPNKGRDLIESPNPCDRCGRVFGNYRALFTHYRQAHRITDPDHVFVPRKPSRTELSIQNFVEAPPSNESLPSAAVVAENVKSPHAKTTPEVADSVDCPKCSRVFTNHKSFVAHLYSAHKVSKDQYSIYWPNGIPILPRESSACPTCNKECLDERAMRIHMFKAHGTHYRDFAAGDQDASKLGGLGTTQGMVTMVNDPSFNQGPEESKSPALPVCSICDRVCKNHRSLISHEFSAHGIRWENGKRVTPNESRNKLSGSPNEGLCNDVATTINGNSSNWGNAYSSRPTAKPFVCPVCQASYRNRRAITTHLCRVHRYKKDGVQSYLSQYFGDNEIGSLVETPASSSTPNGGRLEGDNGDNINEGDKNARDRVRENCGDDSIIATNFDDNDGVVGVNGDFVANDGVVGVNGDFVANDSVVGVNGDFVANNAVNDEFVEENCEALVGDTIINEPSDLVIDENVYDEESQNVFHVLNDGNNTGDEMVSGDGNNNDEILPKVDTSMVPVAI